MSSLPDPCCRHSPVEGPAHARSEHSPGLARSGGSRSTAEREVSVRSSAKKDHTVYFERDKKMKMLNRHLMADHGIALVEGVQAGTAPFPRSAESRYTLPILSREPEEFLH
jgi:hypothetical protein